MRITALSKSPKVFDPVRKKQVVKTPEEMIRQWVLKQMIDFLAFPKGLISVEARVGNLRRADILVFRKANAELVPLLIVECKADALDDEKAFLQAIGYQSNKRAPFLCIAHPLGIRTFWKQEGVLQSAPFLPPYPQLIKRVLG